MHAEHPALPVDDLPTQLQQEYQLTFYLHLPNIRLPIRQLHFRASWLGAIHKLRYYQHQRPDLVLSLEAS